MRTTHRMHPIRSDPIGAANGRGRDRHQRIQRLPGGNDHHVPDRTIRRAHVDELVPVRDHRVGISLSMGHQKNDRGDRVKRKFVDFAVVLPSSFSWAPKRQSVIIFCNVIYQMH